MNRLVLIDGNAILHRAYHALPPLTNRNGQQVNAVYGFASIMLRILDELKPKYFAVAFDRPEPTFRKQLYIGYQSKRKEMDAELAGQIDLVHELVEAYGVGIFEKPGYEADDILGTIAKRLTESTTSITSITGTTGDKNSKIKIQISKTNLKFKDKKPRNDVDEVVIVTGDRDLMQLVNEQVKLYMPTRGMSEGEMVGVNEVKERLGVLPEQVVDYKALVGDGSDNYPGVMGVGPKGALDLLNKFGDFENILKAVKASNGKGDHRDQRDEAESTEIADSVRLKILNGLEGGKLSYRLATIKTDVEVELDIEKLKVEGLNKTGLGEFFRKMNFRSLLKRVEGGVGGGGDGEKPHFAKATRGKKDIINENQQSLF